MRLAKALIRLADLQGTGSEPQPHVTVTQRALGQLIGLSRESTNKHLREWEVAGLVKLETAMHHLRPLPCAGSTRLHPESGQAGPPGASSALHNLRLAC